MCCALYLHVRHSFTQFKFAPQCSQLRCCRCSSYQCQAFLRWPHALHHWTSYLCCFPLVLCCEGSLNLLVALHLSWHKTMTVSIILHVSGMYNLPSERLRQWFGCICIHLYQSVSTVHAWFACIETSEEFCFHCKLPHFALWCVWRACVHLYSTYRYCSSATHWD